MRSDLGDSDLHAIRFLIGEGDLGRSTCDQRIDLYVKSIFRRLLDMADDKRTVTYKGKTIDLTDEIMESLIGKEGLFTN